MAIGVLRRSRSGIERGRAEGKALSARAGNARRAIAWGLARGLQTAKGIHAPADQHEEARFRRRRAATGAD
jgi:hypothetical protein